MRMKSFIAAFAIVGVARAFGVLHGQTSAVVTPSISDQTASAQPAALKLPVPSGPDGIGRVGYEWTDNARSDPYSADPKAHRALMVYIWYPAPRNAAGGAEPYLPGARQMDANPEARSHMTDEFGAHWPLIVSGAIKSHAIENAPVAKSQSLLPLVIFSHGAGGTGLEYTALIEDLVSHGYVVAAIEHTYMAAAVTFRNGTVVPAHHDAEPAGLTQQQRWQRMMDSVGHAIREGAEDQIFALNTLAELNKSGGPDFPLLGRLDLNRAAAMGHSAGGAFATGACQLDVRFHACVSLDGEMPPVAAFPQFNDGKGFQQPVMLLEVDHAHDRMPFSPAQFDDFRKKVEAQLNLCPAGSYDVLLKAPGLFHGSFSDYPLSAAKDARENEVAIHNLSLTQRYTRAFLDKYLKGEKEPLLDEASQTSEAEVKSYGH